MLQDVAMPDESARDIERGFDPSDLPWISNDHVSETGFPWLRWQRVAHQLGWRQRHAFLVRDQRLPIDNLKLHLVEVNRMSVLGEVVQLPQFGRVQRRIF